MSNRTTDFDAPIQNEIALTSYIVGTGNVIPIGCLVQLDNSGNLRTLDATSTNKCVGRAVQGTDGTEAAGTVINVQEGDLFLALAGSAAPTQANLGADIYAASNFEIATTNTFPKAGKLVGLFTNYMGVSGAFVRCTLATT